MIMAEEICLSGDQVVKKVTISHCYFNQKALLLNNNVITYRPPLIIY